MSVRRSQLLVVAWIASAAAVLSKGIAAFVLTGGAWVLHALVHREPGFLARIWSLPGFLIFWVIVLPWFLLVEQRNPGFSEFFFLHEHFASFPKVHRQDGPLWYFVPILLLAVLPMFGTWREGLARAWREPHATPSFPALRFLALWWWRSYSFSSPSHSRNAPLTLLPRDFRRWRCCWHELSMTIRGQVGARS
jgi:4-amino-4-deoxy-L-arabinose transferase-like glycosyltransferase